MEEDQKGVEFVRWGGKGFGSGRVGAVSLYKCRGFSGVQTLVFSPFRPGPQQCTDMVGPGGSLARRDERATAAASLCFALSSGLHATSVGPWAGPTADYTWQAGRTDY